MGHTIKHEVAVDDCENCHMANGNQHPQEGVKGFELGDAVPALCFMCHEENTKTNIHPPAEEECLMCHLPHSSANMALLKLSPPADLCADCHELEMTKKPFLFSTMLAAGELKLLPPQIRSILLELDSRAGFFKLLPESLCFVFVHIFTKLRWNVVHKLLRILEVEFKNIFDNLDDRNLL